MGRDIGILHTQGLRTWGTNKRNWHEVLDYETCGDAKYQKCLSFWKSLGWSLNVFLLFFFLQVFQVKWNCYFGFGRKKQWNRRRKSKMTWTSCLSQSLDRKCQQVCYVQRAVNAGTHQVTGWGDPLSQWTVVKETYFFLLLLFSVGSQGSVSLNIKINVYKTTGWIYPLCLRHVIT